MDRRKIRESISTGSEKIVVKSAGTKKEFEYDKVFPQEVSQGESPKSNLFIQVLLYI